MPTRHAENHDPGKIHRQDDHRLARRSEGREDLLYGREGRAVHAADRRRAQACAWRARTGSRFSARNPAATLSSRTGRPFRPARTPVPRKPPPRKERSGSSRWIPSTVQQLADQLEKDLTSRGFRVTGKSITTTADGSALMFSAASDDGKRTITAMGGSKSGTPKVEFIYSAGAPIAHRQSGGGCAKPRPRGRLF